MRITDSGTLKEAVKGKRKAGIMHDTSYAVDNADGALVIIARDAQGYEREYRVMFSTDYITGRLHDIVESVNLNPSFGKVEDETESQIRKYLRNNQHFKMADDAAIINVKTTYR